MSTQRSAFLEHLASERRLSIQTVASYQRQLAYAEDYAKQHQINDWQQWTQADVRQLVAQLHRQGLSPRSLQLLLSTLRTFFNYLIRESLLEHNPAQAVASPKVKRKLPQAIDVDGVHQFIEGITGEQTITLRDRAMIELFYSCALRLSELVALDLSDIDWSQATVSVLGKGGKMRIVPVGKQAQCSIKSWLAVRTDWLKDHDDNALFISQQGRRINPRTVQQRLRYWSVRLGFDENVYPHKFRHSCATHLLESSSDIRAVQEFLGHANLTTTQVYTHLDFQHLAQVYDKAHPRARVKKNNDKDLMVNKKINDK